MPDQPQTPELFTAADLTNWLRQPVAAEHAAVAQTVVWGWLRPLLGVTELAEVSPEIKAWAIELGAIAYTNPEGLSAYSLGTERSAYSSERRDEILRMVASGGAVAPGTTPSPRGSFPPAPRYPDPAECRPRW